MHDQSSSGNIEDPVLNNSSPGIQFSLGHKIKAKSGIGYLHDEPKFVSRGLASRISREGLLRTIISGSGSFEGLSAGATSMGA